MKYDLWSWTTTRTRGVVNDWCYDALPSQGTSLKRGGGCATRRRAVSPASRADAIVVAEIRRGFLRDSFGGPVASWRSIAGTARVALR